MRKAAKVLRQQKNFSYLCKRILLAIALQLIDLTTNLKKSMQITKEILMQNKYLVSRVSLTDTVKNIPDGITASFDALIAGPITSARSCVSRLNKAAGYEAYKIYSKDNGLTYSITHKRRNKS